MTTIPRIDVCIATCRRPGPLRELLASLLCQDTDGKLSYRIIISDNDGDRGAEAVAREFGGSGVPIVYDVEPRRSISLNRNRALSHTSGDYIAFLDDDQYVGRRWLLSLYDTLVSSGADVAFGAVIPVFEESTSLLIRKSGGFGVPNFPEGCTERIIAHAGNCCFRAAVIAGMPAPFDAALGDRAGEDTKFFATLRQRGRRLVWSRDATCHERVPPERATLRWIVRRNFQTGFMLIPTCGEQGACEILRLFRPLQRLDLAAKIVAATFLLPVCAGLSIVSHDWIPRAVTCLRHLSMYLGCSYYMARGSDG